MAKGSVYRSSVAIVKKESIYPGRISVASEKRVHLSTAASEEGVRVSSVASEEGVHVSRKIQCS